LQRFIFSCVHYYADNKDQNKKQKQQKITIALTITWSNKRKDNQKNWDSYNDLISSTTLTTTPPDPQNSTEVIVIDESEWKIACFRAM
jgi:hypothetical protein